MHKVVVDSCGSKVYYFKVQELEFPIRYSRKYLTDPRIEPLRDCFVHFNIQYFLSVSAPKLGFRTVEIPVERVYPDDGSVPTKVVGFARVFRAFWEMVLTVIGWYDCPVEKSKP